MADIATYQIGIVGPTRVGKTSLVATLLQDGQQALTGTSVSLKAEGGPTSRRLFQHRNEMRASVDAGEFSGSLGGTTDAFTFRLVLDAGDPDSVLRFDILDYPGGWLESGGQGWETVQDFLTDSSVMLVPVDATVLVEAVTRDQKYTSLNLLAVQHVHQLVVEWSKRRNEQPEEPALLMLIPVKCESYLLDSGALRDRSHELRERTRVFYGELVQEVKANAPDVDMSVYYCPVDTLGCVELLSATWTPPAGDFPGSISTHFAIRPPAVIRTRGMQDVLTVLCRHLLRAKARLDALDAQAAGERAADDRALADRSEGFFRNVWLALSGERRRRQIGADESEAEFARATKRSEAVAETVQVLGQRPTGHRLESW